MHTLSLLLLQRIRRDWFQLSLWIFGTALLAVVADTGVQSSFPTAADRQGLLMTVFANPVILLFRGLPTGTDQAAFTLFLILPFLVMDAAFMSTFLAVRHTRADEETGRYELLSASGAGRFAPFLATLIHGVLANLGMAAAITIGYLLLGFDAWGSVISGAATGAAGIAFLAIGLLAGQVMPTSRSANSVGVWAVLITFLIAGLGNALGKPDITSMSMQSMWVVWLSPFGWAEQTLPFAKNLIGPIAIALLCSLAIVAVCVAILLKRDLGASLFQERAGRATAPSLRSSISLVWRLNRGAILGWSIGGLLTGALSTSLASVLADAVKQNPQIENILKAMTTQTNLPQATVVIFFTMLGILAAAAAVQVILKARQEESHGRTELVLTSPIGRVKWFSGWLIISLLGALLTLLSGVAGAAAGIAKQSNPQWSLLSDVWVVASGQLLAATIFGVIASLLFVLVPRLTIGLSWSLLVVGMTLGLFGPLFSFPRWLIDLAPFTAVPTLNDGKFEMQSGVALLIFAITGIVGALAAMRWREMASE